MKRYLVLIALVLSQLSFSVSANTCSSGIYKLYMDVNGVDGSSGSSSAPLQTLNGVHSNLLSANPQCEVEVHIAPGTYLNQSVVWTYTNGHRITLTNANFGGNSNRPVFLSTSPTAYQWFDLQVQNGANSNIHFRYLEIQNYWGGIRLFGNANTESAWNGNNEIFGMMFRNIGGKYNSHNSSKGFAAINAFNSRNNVIKNNFFINIENDSNCPACMHAVYLAHFSSNNTVSNNYIRYVSGNPLQNRDQSNNNRYEFNDIHRAGALSPGGNPAAQIQDWICIDSGPYKNQSSCPRTHQECPSHTVLFYNNVYGSLYNGTNQLLAWAKEGPDDFCGALPATRLSTSGNTTHF